MCCRGSGPGPNPDLILPKFPWQLIHHHPKENTEIWIQSLSHLMPFAKATACFENAAGGERGTASRKQRSGANHALKGKPTQVSTVRTEKLVFSLN